MLLMENKVVKGFKEGRKTYGFYLQSPSKKFIEMMGAAGMDFVRLDLEGGIYDLETLGEMILIARACGVTPFVRICPPDPLLIKRVINMGAMGITMPEVDDLDELRMAVNAAKSPPVGAYRGGASAFSSYGFSTAEYEAWSQENVVVGVQIERKDAFEALDEILQIPGIDMICSGRGSLSKSYGYKSQYDPFIVDIERQTMEKALAAGKITSVCYSVLSNPELYENVERLGKMGVSSFAFAGESGVARFMEMGIEKANRFFA